MRVKAELKNWYLLSLLFYLSGGLISKGLNFVNVIFYLKHNLYVFIPVFNIECFNYF